MDKSKAKTRDYRRRHAIPALLAVAALAGSFLFAVTETDDASRRQRRRATAAAPARAERRLAKPKPKRVGPFKDPKTVVPRVDPGAVAVAAGGPNVIYLVHEGLSGGIALNTAEGAAAMP